MESFPGLEHVERRNKREVTIRPAIHLGSLTGRWQQFVADATASALAPFPMSLTSSEYVVAFQRRGGKSAPFAHCGISRQTTGEVVRL